MKLLLDTHILLWAANDDKRLSADARQLMLAPHARLFFSSASLWEVVIKSGLGRPDFAVDAHALLQGLRASGYEELAVTSHHALQVSLLPPIHKDPFDRLLLAQARTDGMTLLTADQTVAQYGAPARQV